MRYAEDHKAQTRQRILQVAAAEIRARGIDRVSVSDVMAANNLTNGGFYAHFASKDDLVAEAITHMFGERYGRFLSNIDSPNAMRALNAFVDFYLSERHLKAPELGCPIPALAADVQHMSKEAKKRFSAGVTRLIDGLAKLLDQAGVGEPLLAANSILAELSGAITLARTVDDPVRSNEALTASRQTLKRRLHLLAGATTLE
jgi:TetR/AcrR family transcriptional regulator, transcriptional repressor for nem operon